MQMHICKCDVRLSGDPSMQVPKINVSVPEILVLRAIHGDDAVLNVERTDVEVRTVKDEMERLQQVYQARTEEGRNIVLTVFPGAIPSLPGSLADIGIDDGVTATTACKRRKAREAVERVAPTAPEDEETTQE